jgi:hypothetical protein
MLVHISQQLPMVVFGMRHVSGLVLLIDGLIHGFFVIMIGQVKFELEKDNWVFDKDYGDRKGWSIQS